jgi:hypothetical protein
MSVEREKTEQEEKKSSQTPHRCHVKSLSLEKKTKKSTKYQTCKNAFLAAYQNACEKVI